MRRLTKVAAALTALTLFACQDASTPTNPAAVTPLLEIEQINSSFTFLPPLVQAPAREGTFDGSKNPVVLICELRGDECGTGPYVAGFLRTIGTQRIQVDAAEETYAIDWHTARWNLSPSKMYRLKVLNAGREAGHVDLDVVASASEAAAVDRSQFAPLVVGATLPIRFKFVTGSAPQQGTVRGRVVDASTDEPLGGATVSSSGRETTSAEDGTFSLQLPAGARDIAFARGGYTGRTVEDVSVAAGATAEMGDVELEPVPTAELGTARGRVVDADTDEPIAGARVQSGEEETTSGDDGTFSLELAAGDHDLAFSKDGYVSRTLQDVDVAAGESEDVGDVELEPEASTEPGTVHGRVLDAATDQPLAGVSVSSGGRSATSGADGTFSLELAAGEHDLGFSKTGYVSKTVNDVDVEAEETTEIGDVELSPVVVGGITLNTVRVGSGLMVATAGGLGTAAGGALTLRIESSNPSKVLLSRTSAQVGAAFVEIPLASGANTFTYWVHAIGGETGSATLTALATGYSNGTETATIVQPQLHIASLPTEASATAANVPFRVRVDAAASATDQFVRRGGGSYAVTVSSSSAAIGKVVTSGDSEGSVIVQIAEGENMSATTVAGGGVAFDPVGQGTATITAAAAGAVDGTRNITVTGGGTLLVRDTTVGGGLQYQTRVILSTDAHGPLTLRLESSDPSKVRLSRFGNTVGTEVLEIAVASGVSVVTFVVQGMEGVTSTATVTASAPGFGSDEATITVVRPQLSIINLETDIAASSANQDFRVRASLPGSTSIFQAARFGGGGFPITLTSSNGTAAHIAVGGGSTGASVTARIPEGQSHTPFSGDNSLFVDPRAAGATTIAVSSAIASGDSEAIQITGGAVAIQNVKTGAGLEYAHRVTLPTGAHGGVSVTITSSDPSKVLLRTTSGTSGQASITVPVGNGSINAFFNVQGVRGSTGTATLTATATGFASDDAIATVVQPAVEILGLFEGQRVSIQDGAWDVRVRVGVPASSGPGIETGHYVAVGTSALTATLTNSNTTAGRLVGTGASPGSATLTIQPDQNQSTGVEFEPLAEGTTNLAASIPGFIQVDRATIAVTVYDNTWRIGAEAYRGRIGQRFTYNCPANPPDNMRTDAVYGTDIYTDDSSVCRAAVHAGKITYASGGSVTFEILGDRTNFVGSTRNGVTSWDYSPSWPAYRFP